MVSHSMYGLEWSMEVLSSCIQAWHAMVKYGVIWHGITWQGMYCYYHQKSYDAGSPVNPINCSYKYEEP